MADLGNQKIKDTYQLLLQTDASGNLQKLDGSSPNPFIINDNLRYVDGDQANGYVLISDASGNASWGPVSFSGDVYVSGGSIEGTTIELNASSGGTISIPGLSWSSSTSGDISNSGLTGNVGIGTSTPNEELTIVGAISATSTITTNEGFTSGSNKFWRVGASSLLFANSSISKWSMNMGMYDSYKQYYGNDNDMSIYHNGSSGTLDNNTGTLNILSSAITLGDYPTSETLVNDNLQVRDNLSVSGSSNMGLNTLYVDVATNKVGVSTLVPDARLTVSAATGDTVFVTYDLNGGRFQLQTNSSRLQFEDGANTGGLTVGDKVRFTDSNGVTWTQTIAEIGSVELATLSTTYVGENLTSESGLLYNGTGLVTTPILFKTYSGSNVAFQISGMTVMSGSTDLLDIFASSAITNQDVYWSANTDGSITNSGNTDINTTGNGNFANLQVPAGGYLRFDDVIGSDDQYILGNENNITVDGDQKVKLIANDVIEVGVATNDIKLTIDTSEGSISASGNLGISGNTLFGGTLSGTGAVTTLSQIVAASYNSTSSTSGYNLNGTKYLWRNGNHLQVGNTGGTVPQTDIIGISINLQTATTINDNLTVTDSILIGASGGTASYDLDIIKASNVGLRVKATGNSNAQLVITNNQAIWSLINKNGTKDILLGGNSVNVVGDFVIETDVIITGHTNVTGVISGNTSVLSPVISGVTLSASTNVGAPIVSADTITATTEVKVGNGDIGNGLISAGTVNGSYQYVSFFSSISGALFDTNNWIVPSAGGGISNHTWNGEDIDEGAPYAGTNNTVGVSNITPENGFQHTGIPVPVTGFLEGFFCNCRNNGAATNPRNGGLFVGTNDWGVNGGEVYTLRAYAAGDDEGGNSNNKPYKVDGMLATGYPVTKGDIVLPAMYAPDDANKSAQCTWTLVFKA
eukprot:SAG11_NODE_19_length_25345_cov_5.090628_11_plen_921_part_00